MCINNPTDLIPVMAKLIEKQCHSKRQYQVFLSSAKQKKTHLCIRRRVRRMVKASC